MAVVSLYPTNSFGEAAMAPASRSGRICALP
jgi:hypothetical protein